MPFKVTAPVDASVYRLRELVGEKGVNITEHRVLARNLVLYKVVTF